MAALFPPWTNTATHVVLGVLVAGLAGAIAAPMISQLVLEPSSPLGTGRLLAARAPARAVIADNHPRFAAAVAYEGA